MEVLQYRHGFSNKVLKQWLGFPGKVVSSPLLSESKAEPGGDVSYHLLSACYVLYCQEVNVHVLLHG